MLEKIQERKSSFFDKVKELSKRDMPVYLYGAGAAAHNISEILNKNGIVIDGMAVDRTYYSTEMKKEGVFCLDNLLDAPNTKLNLIQAAAKYNSKKIYENKDKIENFIQYDIFHPAHLSEDPVFMSYDWVLEHEQDLRKTYNLLTDDTSKEIFVSYINQRISGNFSHLKGKAGSGQQYFEQGVMPLKDDEVLIDCGAYNGDSAIAFVEELRNRNIHDYSRIYSFEPDRENYDIMSEKNILNHVCIPKGVSDKCGVLAFASGRGTGSSVGLGEDFVEVDSIDHILAGNPATIIKMDIEGSELKALIGAENTIRKYQPKLAICIYHKDEDLYIIPQYIRSLVREYNFYIRIYEEYVNEMVLYAIPTET